MKLRHLFWILAGVALVALGGYRISSARKARQAKPAQALPSALIHAAPVKRATIADTVTVTGSVRPHNEVEVLPQEAGMIVSLSADVGDSVQAHQVLAVIDHRDLAWRAKSAEAARAIAQADLKGAQLDETRTERLFKAGSVSKSRLDDAQVKLALAKARLAQAEAASGLAAQNLADAWVRAPISGTITRRPVNVGVVANKQTVLFTLQDAATLELDASVDAPSFLRLHKGSTATVTVDALPNETFLAKVSLLSPALDPSTRRAAVKLVIDNASGHLLPNMFAQAALELGRLDHALVVPREAVLEAPGGAVIFLVKDGHVKEVHPKLGPRDGDVVAVLSGLSDGDVVATSGLNGLSDGAAVQVAASEKLSAR